MRCRVAILLPFLSLLMATGAQAVFVNVGPDAPVYTSADDLQDAVDDVLGKAGFHQVRIQAGFTANGSFSIPVSQVAGVVLISGGWDSDFDEQIAGPESTVLDGQGLAGPVVTLEHRGTANVQMHNLTVRGGAGTGQGAGIRVSIAGSAIANLDDLIVRDNTASANVDQVEGGGIAGEAAETSTLRVRDSWILDNTLSTIGDIPLRGAGLFLEASGSATIEAIGNAIYGNECSGPVAAAFGSGCGIYAISLDDAGVLVSENIVRDNLGSDLTDISGLNGWLECRGTANIEERQNRWLGGSDNIGGAHSVTAQSLDTCVMQSRSSLFARSPDHGFFLLAEDSSTLHVTNATAAENAGRGGFVSNTTGAATVTVHNSLFYDNDTADLFTIGTVIAANNLVGTDPYFLDPSSDNYSPKPGSPAIDMGTNAPPGGLSAEDLVGRARIAGGIVDIGAYEGPDAIFVDGFESGDLTAWSAVSQ